jgi:hypothetical protein
MQNRVSCISPPTGEYNQSYDRQFSGAPSCCFQKIQLGLRRYRSRSGHESRRIKYEAVRGYGFYFWSLLSSDHIASRPLARGDLNDGFRSRLSKGSSPPSFGPVCSSNACESAPYECRASPPATAPLHCHSLARQTCFTPSQSCSLDALDHTAPGQ